MNVCTRKIDGRTQQGSAVRETILGLALLLSAQGLVTSAARAQTFTSSNLPIVRLVVGRPIPNEPRIDAHMSIVDNGPGVPNHPTDPATDYDGPIAIELRGSSSQWVFPKKAYAVELRRPDGADSTASVLGLPEEEDWILYAPYSDKTFLRNALIMRLSNRIGRYASRTKFVEVVLDGAYQGVYVLMEKIKRDRNRVDIAQLTPDEITGDDLTGGYILKIDKTDGAEFGGWKSDFPPFEGSASRVTIQYHYPKPSEITPEQAEYIRTAFTQFESRMSSTAYDSPVVGYSTFIDTGSAIDFILLNEITNNVDGYRLSTFIYRDRVRPGEPPPRFVFGPIWDFNLGFGNADYYEGWDTENFRVEYQPRNDGFLTPFWFPKLWNEPVFRARARERWTELRQGPFSTDSILTWIDVQAELLREAEARDAALWGNIGVYVWPNPVVWPTWDGELDYLREWITERMDWMDSQLLVKVGVEPEHGLPVPTATVEVYPSPVRSTATIRIRGAVGTGSWSGASVAGTGYGADFGTGFVTGGSRPGQVAVRIVDMTGRVVDQFDRPVLSPGEDLELSFDVRGLSSGVYLVMVGMGVRVHRGSFVVAR